MAKRIVTLITDFGHDDHYVGALKGAILSVNPEATIVDICHNVPAQDLVAAAYVLRCSYQYFPSQTIHVVVVDPTVGSSRRIILTSGDHYYFLAPDNGVLSPMFALEEVSSVREVDAEHYYRKPVAATFHGRDIMAPVAGWLSRGLDVSNFGEPIDDYVQLVFPMARVDAGGFIAGRVIHVDSFGNCVTNITRELFAEAGGDVENGHPILRVASSAIDVFGSHYSQGKEGSPLLLFGSSDFLEIAMYRGRANQALGIERGADVQLWI
ncbi:MAG: SAM-dependent chlorinase/fluorinase [Candidatus Schekmanbacteria bacterium]|nr:SAM-dependent chlorinase/fluorinase [Candidatus Schekmanbacteria bacterium]